MKKLFYYLVSTVAFMVLFASCDTLSEGNATTDGFTTLNISATVPQDEMTKTYFNNSKVYWVSNDVLTVLGNGASAMSNAPTKAVETFDFQVSEWPENIEPQYAVYNGPGGESYDDFKPIMSEDGLITATLRTRQVLYHKNNMSKVANMSVGQLVKSEAGYSTVMQNVCGLIKFTLTKEAKTVQIEEVSESPKYLTGKVKLQINEGKPEVASIVNGNSNVVLEMNADGVLEPASYYACVLPGEYKLKFTILDKDNNTIRELTANSPVNIERSTIVDFGNLNNAVSPSKNIVVELDFNTQPFTEMLPIKSETPISEKTTFVMAGDQGYEFAVCSGSSAYYESKSLRLTTDSKYGYIQVPVIPEHFLVNVEVTCSNKSNKTFYIFTEDPIVNNLPKESAIASLVNLNAAATATKNVNLQEALTAPYYIAANSSNAQISKLVLTYTK